jgi:hypothetical protein
MIAPRFRAPRGWAPALAALLVLALSGTAAAGAATSTVLRGSVSAIAHRRDEWRIPATSGSILIARLRWTDPTANLQLVLFAPDGTRVAERRGPRPHKRLSVVTEQTGDYTVRVRAATGASDYRLAVTVDTASGTGDSAPVAAVDSATTVAGTPVTVYPLANDYDPDGDGLVLQSVSPPAHGMAESTDGSSVTYTPQDGFSGADGFGYTVCDTRTPALCTDSQVDVTVTPSGGPPPWPTGGGPLRWAPPTLVHPQTIVLPATGNQTLHLQNDRDYVISYPATRRIGETRIVGGRNIVIIGGASTIAPHGGHSRNLQLVDSPGEMDGRVIHIEGLDIDASGGGEADGIGIATPSAIVQIENTRITGLIGHLGSTHADVIQTWGGVKALRLYDVTASSHYNNLYLRRENSPLGPPIGPVTLDHVNLFGYVNPPGWDEPTTLRAMSIGTQPANTDCDASGRHCGPANEASPTNCQLSAPVTLNAVYAAPPGTDRLQRFMWPTDYMQQAGCPSQLTADGLSATWPSLDVRGAIQLGPPPAGDFVPVGQAGVGYVSPGYQ